jgi:hypothetical protein
MIGRQQDCTGASTGWQSLIFTGLARNRVVAAMASGVCARGAKPVFLPRQPPDLDPIEQVVFAKLAGRREPCEVGGGGRPWPTPTAPGRPSFLPRSWRR